MEEDKFRPSTITQIGPLFKIDGGDIFLSLFKTFPLHGFDLSKTLLEGLDVVEKTSNEWFETFPDCCPTHKKLKSLENYKKKDYAFIPNQIVNNLAYFAYCLEVFIESDNWFDETTQYLDYLIASFGSPEIGGHIFRSGLNIIIETLKFEDKEFSDDKRLALLEHLEPRKIEKDFEDRDIGILYETFQKWLDLMPAFGLFVDYKKKLTGKIPMNLFTQEMKYNKYLGYTTLKTRSKKELLEFLLKITNDMLKEINRGIQSNSLHIIDNQSHIIKAAEERLKIKQNKLFPDSFTLEELKYLDIVEKWLEILIEYYETINRVTKNDLNKLESSLIETNENVQTIILNLESIKNEIFSITKSDVVRNWIDSNVSNDIWGKIISDIENPNLSDEDRIKLLYALKKYLDEKNNSKIDNYLVNQKLNHSDISVKHKLKFSIPLFFFTRYEAEIEANNKQSLPTTLNEISKLLLDTKK